MMTRASIRRVIDGDFTEADFKSLMLMAREHRASAYLKEAGDMVAHPRRDRGLVFDRLLFNYGQGAILEYQLGRGTFPVDGTCPWWLKHWMLHHIDLLTREEVHLRFGKSAPLVRRDVISVFPPPRFPRRFLNGFGLYEQWLLQQFGERIISRPVIDYVKLREDFRVFFDDMLNLKISEETLDDLCACMCVLFHQTKFEIAGNVVGEQRIHIQQNARDLTGHGVLMLHGAVPLDWKSRVLVSFPMLITDLESRTYFSNDLFLSGNIGLLFDSDAPVQYISREDLPIRAVKRDS